MVLTGQILFGFCNGYFGRDSYENKRIEAIGVDWIVAREIESGEVLFATFDKPEEMLECVSRWSKDEN